MKKYTKLFLKVLMVASCFMGYAQETDFTPQTINANDPNSYAGNASVTPIGLTQSVVAPPGDQRINNPSINLQPIQMVDVEPEDAFAGSSSLTNVEAGEAVSVGGGSIDDSDLWLNYTFRAAAYENAEIRVYSIGTPLPAGMSIQVQIISNTTIESYFGGNIANPNTNPVSISSSPQTLVYSFASSYSGDGIGTGYQLKYTLNNPGMENIPADYQIIYEIKTQ